MTATTPPAIATNPDEPEFETGLSTTNLQAGGVAHYAREQHELQAGFIMAKAHPRNEHAALVKIVASCDRVSFADAAAYAFPRGGATVEGPTVYLAREMARLWGNIRHGIRIVSMDERWCQVEGWALDLETNTRVANEAKFRPLVQRKIGPKGNQTTQWVAPDERDLRELVNKQGAICVRNSILQLMPADFIEDAMSKAKQTMLKAENGEFGEDRAVRTKRMVLGFDAMGVTPAMLEEKIGHSLSIVTPEELVTLRGIWNSIKDGNTKRDDHFPVNGAAAGSTGAPASGVAGLKQKLGVEDPKPAAKTAAPAPVHEQVLEAAHKSMIKIEDVYRQIGHLGGKVPNDTREFAATDPAILTALLAEIKALGMSEHGEA